MFIKTKIRLVIVLLPFFGSCPSLFVFLDFFLDGSLGSFHVIDIILRMLSVRLLNAALFLCKFSCRNYFRNRLYRCIFRFITLMVLN